MSFLHFNEIKAQIYKNWISTGQNSKIIKAILKRVIDKQDKENIIILKLKPVKSISNKLTQLVKPHDFLVLFKGKSVFSSNSQNIFAIVETVTSIEISLKIKLDPQSSQFSIFYELFTQDSEFNMQLICSLNTLEREYLSIDQIRKSPLKNCIVNPNGYYYQNKTNQKRSYFKISKELLSKLNSIYNPSQMKAIKASLKTEGVTLIQGPPGTGKTKTILGILSALISSESQVKKKLYLSEKEREFIIEQNQSSVN